MIRCKQKSKVLFLAACCLASFVGVGRAQEIKPFDYTPSPAENDLPVGWLRDANEVEKALANGVSPNMRNYDSFGHGKRYYNNTILIEAAKHNFIDSARVLLGHGADVDAKNLQGFTALMAAVGTGWVEWIDANSTGYRVGSPEMVKLLLERGADVNARADKGVTALMMAAGSGVYEPSEKSSFWNLVANAPTKTAIVRSLLAKGAEVNARSERGNTALLLAVRTEAEDVARLLIHAGVDKNSKNTALSEAIKLHYNPRFTHIDKVTRLLLEERADPNAFGGKMVERSLAWLSHPDAKFESFSSKYTTLFRLLLENGANVRGVKGARLLEQAAKYKRPDLILLLKQHGARP